MNIFKKGSDLLRILVIIAIFSPYAHADIGEDYVLQWDIFLTEKSIKICKKEEGTSEQRIQKCSSELIRKFNDQQVTDKRFDPDSDNLFNYHLTSYKENKNERDFHYEELLKMAFKSAKSQSSFRKFLSYLSLIKQT